MIRSLFSAIRDWISLAWKGFVRLLGAVWADRTLRLIFLLVLAVDLGFTLWYGVAKVLYETNIDQSLYNLGFLRITTEHGLPEFFDYLKNLVIVLLLARLALSTRQLIYTAFTIVFTVVLLDNSLAIHETAGMYFVKRFAIPSVLGVGAKDIGELIAWGILGLLVFPFLVAGFARSERTHVGNGLALLLPFGALVFCAAVPDLLYDKNKLAFFGSGILSDMIEDGGEMITITIACALAAALVKQFVPAAGPAPADLESTSMDGSRFRPLRRREFVLGCAFFAVVGAAAMIYLNGFVLTSRTKYHLDLTQSPHWVAYHNNSFAKDALLVEYATYNETPIQNGIYWLGTWFIDVVPLEKIVGIAICGLTAALFFLLVSSMAGLQTGVLASLLFVIFPRSAYEIAGGFSKAWGIGFVLAAVYVVEMRTWWVLLWVMPLAALAYPMSAVLIGAIVLVELALEFLSSTGEVLRGLKYLAAGSALALVPLLYKYFTPPASFGEMTSTGAMKEFWILGMSTEIPIPLWEEVLSYIKHPFFVYGTILIFMLLHRRGFLWKRSWSALAVASAACYIAADLVVPHLYVPDRYTRFSMDVLLILWYAYNWSRILETFKHSFARWAAVAAIVVFAAVSFRGTFKPCDGDEKLGRWEDRSEVAPLSRAVAALPQPVLVAGHPYTMADLMIQSRRPVLVIHRLFHHWYRDYRMAIDLRNRYIFGALYARDLNDVNRLFNLYGVTHLVVPKYCYGFTMRLKGNLYKPEYEPFIQSLSRGPVNFVLNPPPLGAILFQDSQFWLVRLPLTEPGPSAKASPGLTITPLDEGRR